MRIYYIRYILFLLTVHLVRLGHTKYICLVYTYFSSSVQESSLLKHLGVSNVKFIIICTCMYLINFTFEIRIVSSVYISIKVLVFLCVYTLETVLSQLLGSMSFSGWYFCMIFVW
jgi:hypothetical protein